MSQILLFIVLLLLGIACYGIFYASVKWFNKI